MSIVKDLERQLDLARKEQAEKDRETWHGWRPIWKWEAMWRAGNSPQNPRDPAHLRIKGTLQNRDEYEAKKLIAPCGPLFSVEDYCHSVGYLRDEEGWLSSIGGGTLVLTDGIQITAEQWAEIKKGNFEGFLRESAKGLGS